MPLGSEYDTRAGRIAVLQRLLASWGAPRPGPLPIPRSPLSGGGGGASGVGVSGNEGGLTGVGFTGPGPTGPTGAITGVDATSIGLMGSFLGSVAPGVNIGSVVGMAGPTAMGLAGVPNGLTMSTDQGPVDVANLTNSQGVFGALMGGRAPSMTNIANTISPTLSALAQNFVSPQFVAIGPNGELSAVSNANAMAQAQAGRSALGGAVGAHGAIGGFNTMADNTAVMAGLASPFGGPRGATDDPTANDPTASPVDDSASGIPSTAPPGDGGGGGGGGTVICTLLAERRLVDRETLRANAAFGRALDADAWRGYHAWAAPLVKACRRSPRLFRVLYALLGPLARAYMRAIARPGSSRLGAVLLAVGVPACRWIGAGIRAQEMRQDRLEGHGALEWAAGRAGQTGRA